MLHMFVTSFHTRPYVRDFQASRSARKGAKYSVAASTSPAFAYLTRLHQVWLKQAEENEQPEKQKVWNCTFHRGD